MAGKRIVIPNYMPALDLNGNPQAGAKITFYANETTDLAAIYTSAALTVQHPNPITADASGVFPSIFADEDTEFSVAITDADDNPIGGLRNRDNIRPSLAFLDGVEAPVSGAMADVLAEDTLTAARATMGTDNAANVNFIPSGTGAVTRTLQARLRDSICVLDFGAIGNGIADDTTAIQNALNAGTGGQVLLPQGAYRITAPITFPGDTKLYGPGRALAVLRKQFDGDFATLNDGSGIEDVGIDLQGATYTGLGLTISGGNQTLRNVNVNNGAGACIYFPDGSGSRFLGDNVQAFRVGSAGGEGLYAVVYQNTLQAAGLTTWRDFKSGGAESFYFGGANNCLISNSALFDCEWTTNSRDISIVNCRMAGTEGYTLIGSGSIIGAGVAPNITINAGGVFTVVPAYTNGEILDNSGGTSVVIQHKVQEYTPVLKAGGVAITLGTGGSYEGRYSRAGKLVTVKMQVIWGTGATIPSGAMTITLPTGAVSTDIRQQCVHGMLQPTSGTKYPIMGFIGDGASEATLEVLASGALAALDNATPSSLGDGTGLYLMFSYEA